VTCRVADRVAAGSIPYPPGHARPYAVHGFHCHARRASPDTALYTCRRARSTVAFQRQ
jgi:hypothetical protein